jgi:ABC-type nitrate/sulfonate/bicarbonate transport system substrate-binding protein
MMRTRRLTITLVCAGLLLTASACTSSGKAKPSTGGTGTITVNGIQFPKPELSSLTIGIASIDVSGVPLSLIPYLGIDKKFGIKLNIKDFGGNAQLSQALVANQIDTALASGGTAVTSLKTGRPEVITYVTLDVDTDILYGNKGVTNADQLRGKSIAVSSFGSQSYAGALLALQALGLTKNDVTLTPVGNDSARLAALKAGSVGAAILDFTLEQQLNSSGYTSLVKIEDLHSTGYPLESLTFPQSFIDKYPNTVLAMTAMMQWGVTEFLKNTDANTAVWAKDSQEPVNQAKAEVTERATAVWNPLDGKCSNDDMNFVKTVAVAADKSLESVDATKGCTDEFTSKLQQMGFQKSIGVKGY